MNVYCSDKINKQIQIEKRKKVFDIIFSISKDIQITPVFDCLKKYNNKVMRGVNNIWKFYIDGNFRIIWTFGKYLTGTRKEESEDIFLLAYTEHDKQVRKAEDISKDINKRNFYIVDYKKYYKRIDINKLNVRLTNDQLSFIQHGLPLMISGGAGNGKTLVALNKLLHLKEIYPNKKIAYFTFTEGLKYNAKEEYIKQGGKKEEPFFVINEYFIKLLNKDSRNFIQYNKFASWYNKIKENDIEAIDIWVDIRGIIKGYMGEHWSRNNPFNIHMINETTRNYLLKNNVIFYPEEKNKKILRCNITKKNAFNKVKTKLNNDEAIESIDKYNMIKDIDKIYNHIHLIKPNQLIYKYDYYNLDDDSSQYNLEEKDYIYNIAKKYQKWLKDNNFYDDNDLALEIINKYKSDNKYNFDFIVIDEIQDLSELQIKAVLSLLEIKEHIVFCGDIHQIIQPTIFSTSRIKKLFNNKIKIKYLTTNHRSQGEIVDFSNKLAYLRRNIIGNRKKETEIREEAVWRDVAPYLLSAKEENVREAINYIINLANVAIVVSNNKEKEKLIGYIRGDKIVANIYTINEIKGLEWSYIFCYNLIGENLQYWKDIFKSGIKHNGKYRYFFNILYVASTRAKDKLCFCEDENLYNIDELKKLFNDTNHIEAFNPLELNLLKGENESEQWAINAKRLEKQKVYDRAYLYYIQSGLFKEAERCDALYAIQTNKIEAGLKQLYNIKEYKRTYELAQKVKNKKFEFLSYIMLNEIKPRELEKRFGEEYIINMYLTLENDSEGKNIIEKKYLYKKAKSLEKTLANINSKINKFIGGNTDG